MGEMCCGINWMEIEWLDIFNSLLSINFSWFRSNLKRLLYFISAQFHLTFYLNFMQTASRSTSDMLYIFAKSHFHRRCYIFLFVLNFQFAFFASCISSKSNSKEFQFSSQFHAIFLLFNPNKMENPIVQLHDCQGK